MKIESIYNKWTEFTNKYNEYFRTPEEQWYITVEKVEKFIIKNGHKPMRYAKDTEENFMGIWIMRQQKNYKKKQRVMKNINIYNKWTEFIDKYIKHFRTNEERWYIMFENVEKFIATHNYKPSKRSKNDQEKVMGGWITDQQVNYKKKRKSMKNANIYNKWTEFRNKYIEIKDE